MSEPLWRRAVRFVGPWPVRPVLEFFVIFFVSLLISSGTMISLRGSSFLKGLFAATVPSLVAAGVIALILWLGRRLAPGLLARSLAAYIGLAVLAAFLGLSARAAFTHLPFSPAPDDLALLPFGTFRYSAWILSTQAVAGYVIQRISRQTVQLQDALNESREQQSQMLIAEERSRRQISLLLHDRVQAGLITACLELQGIAGADDADRARVGGVIDRLESLRRMDVRSAARALSPDLHAVDIHSALSDLARLYEPGMRTEVVLSQSLTSPDRRIPHDVLLGAYRIAEQGLLNAALHGGADHCTLRLDIVDPLTVQVTLTDDGVGFGPEAPVPGFGSTIMTTWTRVLGGSWQWRSLPTGACLQATLPLSDLEPLLLDQSEH